MCRQHIERRICQKAMVHWIPGPKWFEYHHKVFWDIFVCFFWLAKASRGGLLAWITGCVCTVWYNNCKLEKEPYEKFDSLHCPLKTLWASSRSKTSCSSSSACSAFHTSISSISGGNSQSFSFRPTPHGFNIDCRGTPSHSSSTGRRFFPLRYNAWFGFCTSIKCVGKAGFAWPHSWIPQMTNSSKGCAFCTASNTKLKEKADC